MTLPKQYRDKNPNSAYGRKSIRKLLSIQGGKNENENVKKEARSQGWNGVNINSAYTHLSFIVNDDITRKRKEFLEEKAINDMVKKHDNKSKKSLYSFKKYFQKRLDKNQKVIKSKGDWGGQKALAALKMLREKGGRYKLTMKLVQPITDQELSLIHI